MANIETEVKTQKKGFFDFVLDEIDKLPPEERRRLHDLIIVKDLAYYNEKQKEWISVFRYYLGKNREEKGLDCSPEVIKKVLIEELIKGDGRVMCERYKLFHAATNISNIASSYDSGFIDFLTRIDVAFRTD